VFFKLWALQDIDEEELEKSKANGDDCKEGSKPVNQLKNRYGNIKPCKISNFNTP
jgi:hypothetical protein